MDLDNERQYQHLLDQIMQKLEILMMDILLASINRLKYEYEEPALNPYHEADDIDF